MIGVEVINVGRMSVTVTNWEIATAARMKIASSSDAICAPLPCEIGPGRSETRLVDLGQAIAAVENCSEVFKVDRNSVTVRGVVTTATRATLKIRSRRL